MSTLTQKQKDTFWRDGVIVIENAVDQARLSQLRAVFDGWVEDSRAHTEEYGETLEGRPRFDLQLGLNGVFTGAVDADVVDAQRENIVKCTGPAGVVCLMHARLLHGSAPNLSASPRTLYITTYYAEDAVELSPNHLPSQFTHELARGTESGRIRCTNYEMAPPAAPKATSFIAQQEGADG